VLQPRLYAHKLPLLGVVPPQDVDGHDGGLALQLDETVDADASAVGGLHGGLPVLGEGQAGGLEGGLNAGSSAVGLLARIESLTVSADEVARVVVNERTGTVVVGGGVIAAGDLLLEPAREVVATRALSPSRDLVRIVPARFGAESGMLGAAALALDGLQP